MIIAATVRKSFHPTARRTNRALGIVELGILIYSYDLYIRFFLFKEFLRNIANSTITLDRSSYKTQTVAVACKFGLVFSLLDYNPNQRV